MSDTPSDLLHEILLRVPAESLLCCRAVCKTWRSIIDDPTFIKSHTNDQLFSTTVLIRNYRGSCLFSLPLDSLNDADSSQIIEEIANPVKTVVRSGGGASLISELPVPSCNGLILIHPSAINKIWVIWNPLTRDFHELPELGIKLRILGSGLGYDYAEDDYKVVRMYGKGETVYRTSLYGLKSDSWKMIKNCPYPFRRENWRWSDSQGFFLNGALHWMTSDMIIKLDLKTEEFSHLPLPPVATELGVTSHRYLDVLGGYLVFCYYYEKGLLDGWIMKENAWMKLFSIESLKVLRPIAYFQSKGQVVLQYDDTFIFLDIVKNSGKKVKIGGLFEGWGVWIHFTSQICPRSIFRLDRNYDVCRIPASENTKAQRKRANKRRQISATVTHISNFNSAWNDAEE